MTPASIFPPNVTDYFQIDDLLNFEEKVIRNKVRKFMENQLAPIMTKNVLSRTLCTQTCADWETSWLVTHHCFKDRASRLNSGVLINGLPKSTLLYWEKAEFPFEVIPELRRLNITGTTNKGYGCPGLSITASCIIIAEMARVDASFSSFFLVHSYLSMETIVRYGSEAQKQKYLPGLARLETIACWAATEPGSGSDLNSLTTTATKVEGGWILEGQKRWIGNSLFADLLIIIARNTTTNQINGFIVKKGAPHLQVRKIENKIGMRILQNGHILLDGVFVPDEDRLPGINSFEGPSKVLVFMRFFVAWQSLGISMGVYDMCYRYLKERDEASSSSAGGLSKCETAKQQEKVLLAQMLSNIQAMYLLGWRTCKLYDDGKMTDAQASLSKAWNTLKARETVSLGRQLLGGTTGHILTDFHVAKAFCDMEIPYTYDGTYDINTLIVGKEITGISSFRPPSGL